MYQVKTKIRRIAQKTNKAEHKNLANRLKILASKAVPNDKATWWQTKTQEIDSAEDRKTFTKLAVKEHRQRLTTQLLKKMEIQQKTI